LIFITMLIFKYNTFMKAQMYLKLEAGHINFGVDFKNKRCAFYLQGLMVISE
jgi:hypothetical protein